MGCKCDHSSNTVYDTEIKFESNNLIGNEKEIIIKRILTKSELDEKDKFLEELKDNKSYIILDSIKLKEHLTYECINAYEIFMQNKKNFDDIYQKDDRCFAITALGSWMLLFICRRGRVGLRRLRRCKHHKLLYKMRSKEA